MSVYTSGLDGFYVSPLTTIKLAQWERIGLNMKGTFVFTEEDAETTDQYVEETDLPIFSTKKAGLKSITTEIPDMSVATFQRLFNTGTPANVVVEGAAMKRVALPDAAQTINYMCKIVPSDGVEQIYFTKGDFIAKIDGALSSEELLTIKLTVKALASGFGEKGVEIDIKDGTNAGYVLGNSLVDGDKTEGEIVAELAALTAPKYSYTVDGTPYTDVTPNLSGETTFVGVVEKLNAVATSATWSFNPDEYRMKLTSDTKGSTSMLTVQSTSGVDLLIAGNLDMINGETVGGS